MAGAMTLFEFVGGAAPFALLIDRFYAEVANDPILRPMYPEDLDESKRRLSLFLVQYFGGPQTYSEQRGHPRLRMRHVPFPIDQAARDAWLGHMLAALDTLEIPEVARAEMRRYFDDAATFLINRGDPSTGSG